MDGYGINQRVNFDILHILIIEIEEKLNHVLAAIWRGHRNNNYKIDMNFVSSFVDCSPGGLEQMLDRKYKMCFGPGGPLRGAYKTSKRSCELQSPRSLVIANLTISTRGCGG
jgi:hypothetical protein